MQARLPGALDVEDAALVLSTRPLAAPEPAAVATACRTANAVARDAALAQWIRQAVATGLACRKRVTRVGRSCALELGRADSHAGRVLLLRELARGCSAGARGALLRLLNDAVVGAAGVGDVRRTTDSEQGRDQKSAQGSQSHRLRVRPSQSAR